MGVVSQIADQLESQLVEGRRLTDEDVALIASAANLMRLAQCDLDRARNRGLEQFAKDAGA